MMSDTTCDLVHIKGEKQRTRRTCSISMSVAILLSFLFAGGDGVIGMELSAWVLGRLMNRAAKQARNGMMAS